MAKYVNILFLDTLDCFWGGTYKNLTFFKKTYYFSSLSIRKEGNQFNQQNLYSIILFSSISFNTYELINIKGKVNQLTWPS